MVNCNKPQTLILYFIQNITWLTHYKYPSVPLIFLIYNHTFAWALCHMSLSRLIG